MDGNHAQVAVIASTSPMVEAITAKELVTIGRPETASSPTSAQRLQLNPALVADVLNSCFWASLAREEGRPVASGVTFASPDDIADQLTLVKPERLTVDSLIRLGTIAGTSQRLAIHEEGGTAVIWGLLRGHSPFWVTVWFDRPALLRVVLERAGVLCLLDRGRVFVPEGQRLANTWNLTVQLEQLLPTSLPYSLVDGLTFVANEMSRHGHGGTLLVVPEKPRRWEAQVQVMYRLTDSSRTLLARMQQRPVQSDGSTAAAEVVRLNEVIRTATHVADLTKIDGAAVVGFDLTVFGFGGRITTKDSGKLSKTAIASRTIYEKDPAPVTWMDLGGTRHQSAARFVAATKKSAAFVSSHDGGLSALAWKSEPPPGRLEWLRGLEGLVMPR